MKKYLIILVFLPLSLIGWGQNTIVNMTNFNGGILSFNGEILTIRPRQYCSFSNLINGYEPTGSGLGYYTFDGNDIGIVDDTSLFDNPNLITNSGFEDFTGIKDDWINDSFSGWVKDYSNNDSNFCAISSDIGETQLRLYTNYTPSAQAAQQFLTVEPSTEYILRFKYKCNETGRYAIYDEVNDNYIVSSTYVDTTTVTKYGVATVLFETPSNCDSIHVTFITPPVIGGWFYVDEVVLSEPYDFSINYYIKRNVASVDINRDYPAARLFTDETTGNYQRSWSTRFLGEEYSVEEDKGKLAFGIYKYGDTDIDQIFSTTVFDIQDTWYNVTCVADYLGSGQTKMQLWVDGVKESESTVNSWAWNGTADLTFGGLKPPTATHYIQGDMANIQYAKRAVDSLEIANAARGYLWSDVLSQWSTIGITDTAWYDTVGNLNAEMNAPIPNYGAGGLEGVCYVAQLDFVEGAGEDAIYDFSSLSDDRFNKNARVGNTLALPEYYNSDWDYENIYFDTLNPYHWKLKDFHYRYIEEQFNTLTNVFFAKLTYENKEFVSADEIILFDSELIGGELSKMLDYIGILPDYWGDERNNFASAHSDSNGNEANDVGEAIDFQLSEYESQSSEVSVGSYAIEAGSNTTPFSSSRFYFDLESEPFNCVEGGDYIISFDYRHVGVGGVWRASLSAATNGQDHTFTLLNNTLTAYLPQSLSWTHDDTYRYFNCREVNSGNDGGVYFDNLNLKEFFSDYYSGEGDH